MVESKDKLVSIVIPTYNHAAFLRRAIQSVIDQTYKNWEILIVDNHSTDNTDEIIASFQHPAIKAYKINNNGVIAASRNKGLTLATGEYIAFLDSDDWWLPKKLEVSIMHLEKGNDVVYHDLWEVKSDDQTKRHKLSSRKLKRPVFKDLLIKGNALYNSSVVLKSHILKTGSLLDENKEIIASEDYDFWIRLAFITDRFFKIPDVLGFYWRGETNISRQRNFSIAGRIILKKHEPVINKNVLSKAKGFHFYSEGIYQSALNRKEAGKLFLLSLVKGHSSIKMKSVYRLIRLYI